MLRNTEKALGETNNNSIRDDSSNKLLNPKNLYAERSKSKQWRSRCGEKMLKKSRSGEETLRKLRFGEETLRRSRSRGNAVRKSRSEEETLRKSRSGEEMLRKSRSKEKISRLSRSSHRKKESNSIQVRISPTSERRSHRSPSWNRSYRRSVNRSCLTEEDWGRGNRDRPRTRERDQRKGKVFPSSEGSSAWRKDRGSDKEERWLGKAATERGYGRRFNRWETTSNARNGMTNSKKEDLALALKNAEQQLKRMEERWGAEGWGEEQGKRILQVRKRLRKLQTLAAN